VPLATTQEFTVVSGCITCGVKNLCFRNSGSPTGTTVLYIDDVVWEAIPSCRNKFISFQLCDGKYNCVLDGQKLLLLYSMGSWNFGSFSRSWVIVSFNN
jgi:hypothetical protein